MKYFAKDIFTKTKKGMIKRIEFPSIIPFLFFLIFPVNRAIL